MPDFFVRGPSQPPLRPRPWGRAHAAPPAPLSPKARQRGASFQPEYPPSPLPILLLFIFTILGGGAGRALSAAAVREKPGRRAGPAPRSQGGRGGSAMRERGGGGEEKGDPGARCSVSLLPAPRLAGRCSAAAGAPVPGGDFSVDGFSPPREEPGKAGGWRLLGADGSLRARHPLGRGGLFLSPGRHFDGGARRPRGAKARFATTPPAPGLPLRLDAGLCREGAGGVPLPTGQIPREERAGQAGRGPRPRDTGRAVSAAAISSEPRALRPQRPRRGPVPEGANSA